MTPLNKIIQLEGYSVQLYPDSITYKFDDYYMPLPFIFKVEEDQVGGIHISTSPDPLTSMSFYTYGVNQSVWDMIGVYMGIFEKKERDHSILTEQHLIKNDFQLTDADQYQKHYVPFLIPNNRDLDQFMLSVSPDGKIRIKATGVQLNYVYELLDWESRITRQKR